ncbi:MAG: carbohydrate-binding domain-containing protein [Ruminococcaceae bacterium]|nr:carbohydrate-binding domain-containing protein [Oscillospiraceae bacterium]
MKFFKIAIPLILAAALLTSCQTDTHSKNVPDVTETPDGSVQIGGVVSIHLSDDEITVDGKTADYEEKNEVFLSNDIVYYESGKDFTYGEGTEKDAHTEKEAQAHTVVNITSPGTYSVSGKLSCGQIAIDLGEDAKKDPTAVVTLVMNGADITCEVAPAVIFYNVYECSDSDTEKATKAIDTSLAGANVIIADDSVNNVVGSYVARIYKPGTVELSEDGTEVSDAKKLHKYDAAFYSKMSMNVSGGDKGNGVLNIQAENEGLDSELHLTLNGGNINIWSGNDGINTNEDYVSVTTINGGNLNIKVTGSTGEGDGIDSNGWLVINGGTVITQACSDSADAGIDSDMDIHINGGTVISTGHMLDRIEDGGQTYAVFNFAQKHKGTDAVTLKNEKGDTVMSVSAENEFSVMILSSPELAEGVYTLWDGETKLGATSGTNGQRLGGMGGGRGFGPGANGPRPDGAKMPFGEHPEGKNFSKKERPDGERPESFPEGNRFGDRGGNFETAQSELCKYHISIMRTFSYRSSIFFSRSWQVKRNI